jgi:DNA-binding PadR family transcriptional regulator
MTTPTGEPSPDELQLLASYADGPRIWDAASLFPTVMSLHDRGLIEPVTQDGVAFRLTDAGRARLQSQPPVRAR